MSGITKINGLELINGTASEIPTPSSGNVMLGNVGGVFSVKDENNNVQPLSALLGGGGSAPSAPITTTALS